MQAHTFFFKRSFCKRLMVTLCLTKTTFLSIGASVTMINEKKRLHAFYPSSKKHKIVTLCHTSFCKQEQKLPCKRFALACEACLWMTMIITDTLS